MGINHPTNLQLSHPAQMQEFRYDEMLLPKFARETFGLDFPFLSSTPKTFQAQIVPMIL
jgi:hypothetical protein